MRGFATGGGAGVQHSKWSSRVGGSRAVQQQRCCQLSRSILYRDHAIRKAGDVLHRPGFFQRYAEYAYCCGPDSRCGQLTQIVITRRPQAIHPQRHGSLGEIGLQDGLPLSGIVLFQPRNPPGRVVPPSQRVGICRRDQVHLFTQKTSQAGVDEVCLGLGCLVSLSGLNGLVHQGEGLVGCIRITPRQRQGRAQQRIRCGRWRATSQVLAQRLRPPERTKHLKRQRLYTGAQGRRHFVERGGRRLACAHCEQNCGRGLKLLPQRDDGGIQFRHQIYSYWVY